MSNIQKVLVVGGSGLVASRFVELAKTSLDITSVDEKIVDITDKKSVNDFFKDRKFDAIVNFAAMTNVDAAEKERGKQGFAWKLNVEGVRNLIDLAEQKEMLFVQISTDFVFPGDKSMPGPYDETDQPPQKIGKKISWYGWTKRIAEKEVLLSKTKTAIVRIAYPFRADNFQIKLDWARKLLELFNEDKLYPFFTDQAYSILYIDDLVKPLSKIVKDKLTGVYHIVSSDTSNPYDVAKYLLQKYSGRKVNLQKGSMVDFMKAPGRTPRPRFGGLKTEKTEKKLGMKFKTWKQMVDEYVKKSVKYR